MKFMGRRTNYALQDDKNSKANPKLRNGPGITTYPNITNS